MYNKDNSSEESLLGHSPDPEKSEHFPYLGPATTKKRRCFLIAEILFFIVSCSLALYTYLGKRSSLNTWNHDFEPMWSPALDAVRGTGYFTRFDGSFGTQSKYKGTPNVEIDQTWEDITYATGGVISISEDVLKSVNGSTEYSVQLSEADGGGFMASVEVLHQLHCLDMLRKATYVDYYHDKAGEWTDSPQTLRFHLDHCIDNLRQKLMCDADAGILTYVWVAGHTHPFPDFNVQHKCRSFDAVRQWVTDRQLYTADGGDVVRIPGAGERPSPP